MKKLVLMLGLACLFMVACNDTKKDEKANQANQPAQTQTTNATPDAKKEGCGEKHDCPMHGLKDQLSNWEKLDDNAKNALIDDAKKLFADADAKMEEMKKEGKEACKEMSEACEKKCAEMKAAWEDFDNKTLDEKKDLIMKRLEGCEEGHKECCKGEKEGCQGNHEGCQHAK